MTIADTQLPQHLDTPRHLSRMAVASLVLSIVFCCPVTTIAGIVTGSIAIVMTMRDRTLSGRWMAITAICIGLTATAIQAMVIAKGYQIVMVPVLTGPESAIKSGEAGNIELFQAGFVPKNSANNSPDNARLFLAELKSRYGALSNAALDQGSAPNQMAPSGRDFVGDYMLDFANGRIRTTCSIEIFDPAGSLSVRMTQLVVHDAERGDLTYPPSDEVLKAPAAAPAK